MRTHTKTFHIRFTETEYDRLCKYAAKAGLPKSTYIRHMINGCCPREHPNADFFDFFRQAYSCGNLLNQLCRAAHTFGSLHTKGLLKVTNHLYDMMDKIYKEYISLDDLDIPATLERGRQLAEAEQRTEGDSHAE